MLSNEVIAQIEEMLAEGRIPYRMIAENLGVSRGTVVNVAMGRRPQVDETAPPKVSHHTETVSVNHSDEPRRCPGCGGLVYGDCVLCVIRNARQGPNSNVEAVEPDQLYGVLTQGKCEGIEVRKDWGEYIPTPDEIYKAAQEIREENQKAKVFMERQRAEHRAKRLLASGVFESRVRKSTGLSRAQVRKLAKSVKQPVAV
jgi:DNA-binding transcriptional ArsR family regulator